MGRGGQGRLCKSEFFWWDKISAIKFCAHKMVRNAHFRNFRSRLIWEKFTFIIFLKFQALPKTGKQFNHIFYFSAWHWKLRSNLIFNFLVDQILGLLTLLTIKKVPQLRALELSHANNNRREIKPDTWSKMSHSSFRFVFPLPDMYIWQGLTYGALPKLTFKCF